MKKKGSLSRNGTKRDGKANTFEKTVVIDFWLTNIHDAEIGIFQQERYMAKNRLFSKNLEIVGAVKEKGKVDGIFGYNTE